jgi:hypothetical protein
MTASALSAALSLLFPPLSYVSGAVVGLATLKHGPREGLWVIAGSVPLAALFAVFTLGTATPALAFLGMTWLPAWLMAVVLGLTRSQGTAVVVAAALGVLAVVVMHVIVDDPVTWWRHLLAEFFAPAMRGAQAPEVAQLNLLLDAWAPRMTRIFGAVSVVGLVATLLISRHWHAMLDNPGGFGREFRELRVGTPAIGVAVAVAVAAWLYGEGPGHLTSDLMGPLSVMLVFQGLAVVHSIASQRKLSVGWLVAMYVLLLVPPHLALPALAMVGAVDGLMNLRARVAGKHS